VRKVTFSVLGVIIACAVCPGAGFAAKFDRMSITFLGGVAYQDLGDLQTWISNWNDLLEFAAATGETDLLGVRAEDIGTGYSLLGGIRYRVGPRMLLAFRVEYITDNSSTLASFFGNEFSAAAVPVTVTGIYEIPGLFPGFLRKAKLNLGLGAGPVLRGVYKYEMYFPPTEILTTRATSRGFQIHGLAEVEYPLLDRWGIMGEVSYRYTKMGDLTYGSVTGDTDAMRAMWEGDGTPNNPGIYPQIAFPHEGEPVYFPPNADEMGLDFSGFNLHLALRFYAW